MSSPLFLDPNVYRSMVQTPSVQIYNRAELTPQLIDQFMAVQRGDFSGFNNDPNQALAALTNMMMAVNRNITSTTSNLPIRENLEAEAKSLVPRDTPLRNRIPRKPGAGLASKWRQTLSYGGGYGAATTLTTATANNASGNSTPLVFTSTAGFRVGDFIQVGSGATIEIAQITVISGANVTIAANLANDQRSSAVVKVAFQPGGGSTTRVFFAENGAPAEFTTVYGARTAAYKLLGGLGSITGLAMAAGANFQNQLATEKTNSLINTMLNEENALLNGDSSATAAPWGDGTTALAFDGLLILISTGNGVPANQIQASVGQLTTTHIDAMLTRLYYQGARNMYMIMAGQEITSLAKIATGGSNNYRIMLDPKAATLGTAVTGYLHPITGELVPIIPHRFLSPGTIVYGADQLPDGNPALEVEVLPQVQLPELAPNDSIQGYTVQEVAPSVNSPQLYPFITTVFEVLKMKGSTVFGKSTGVTPA